MTETARCWRIIDRIYAVDLPMTLAEGYGPEPGTWHMFNSPGIGGRPNIVLLVKTDQSRYMITADHHRIKSADRLNVLRVLEARLSRDVCKIMAAITEERHGFCGMVGG